VSPAERSCSLGKTCSPRDMNSVISHRVASMLCVRYIRSSHLRKSLYRLVRVVRLRYVLFLCLTTLASLVIVTGGVLHEQIYYCNNVTEQMFKQDNIVLAYNVNEQRLDRVNSVSLSVETTIQSRSNSSSAILFTGARPERFEKSCLSFRITADGIASWFPTPLLLPDLTERSVFPKILHRLWKTKDVPDKWNDGVSTCMSINTDHQYCHWTDKVGLKYRHL